jgi:hypothetical protein
MPGKMVGTLRFAHPMLLEKSGGFATGQVYGCAGGSGQP